jgi:hypothetical protein
MGRGGGTDCSVECGGWVEVVEQIVVWSVEDG